MTKFKQSLFSLKLAVEKCKITKQINNNHLSECLLWTIYVSKIYLINKIRVIKNYQITKKEQKAEQQAKIKESQFINFYEVSLD